MVDMSDLFKDRYVSLLYHSLLIYIARATPPIKYINLDQVYPIQSNLPQNFIRKLKKDRLVVLN